MQVNKLRIKPGEYISIEIDTEVSVLIHAHPGKLEIHGPVNRLSKVAVVSTHGMVITDDFQEEI